MNVYKPHPYQKLITRKIIETPRSCIWAGMGMGKTVASLTAFEILRAREGYKRLLILAPLRVAKYTWANEAKKWAHLHHLGIANACGTPRERTIAFINQDKPIICMNYDNLPWLVESVKAKKLPARCLEFDMIICDEATRIKGFRRSSGSQRAKALNQFAFLKSVKRFVELTGTPASNGYLDLWGQFWFIDRGERLCSSFKAYQMTYFTPTRVGNNAFTVRWDIIPGSEQAILERTRDVTLKLNSEDWFSIEKPIIRTVEVNLSGKARKIYDDMERELYAELSDEESVVAVNAAVKTGKCLQIASGALYTDDDNSWEAIHEEKIEALRSIVEEASGAPVLVAYQFKHEAERILKAFKQAKKLDKNPKTIDEWNAGRIPILLAHPASCGHGLSLQDGGNILVFFSTGWNLEEHEQIIERIGPMRQMQSGHKRNVFVYYITAKNTLDEAVQKRLQTKRSVLDVLLERRL